MTQKTKAHGYCSKGELHRATVTKQFANLYMNKNPTREMPEPICLLSPSTIDKVREFVEAMRKRDLNQSEIYYAAELLKLLPEVE